MKMLLLILPIFALLFISPETSNSMCIYNRSSVKDLKVGLCCGFACANTWTLQPCPPAPATTSDCYACRHDKGGNVAAGMILIPSPGVGVFGCTSVEFGCTTKVEPHGWVLITGDMLDELKCKSCPPGNLCE